MENIKKPVDALMQKEMSRREFLVTVGLGAASILGLSSILHFLTGKSFSVNSRGRGYGSNGYGL